MDKPKTHYNSNSVGLFCSGRSPLFALVFTTSIMDEVTCGSCRRKLVARSKKAAVK